MCSSYITEDNNSEMYPTKPSHSTLLYQQIFTAMCWVYYLIRYTLLIKERNWRIYVFLKYEAAYFKQSYQIMSSYV